MKSAFFCAFLLCLASTAGVNGQTASQPAPLPNLTAPDYQAQPMAEWEKKFATFEFKTREENTHLLPYRFHRPESIAAGRKYPLVLFMHGAGERGSDNRTQFLRFKETAEFWKTYPCYVIAPQCPAVVGNQDGESVWVQTGFGAPEHTTKPTPPWPMRLAIEVLNEVITNNAVDTNRIYITGLSMGGFATWDLLQREPGRFAAAIPICGGADLSAAPELTQIPIWVFHGDADDTVQPRRSRDMVAALTAAGGHPIFTVYPGAGHDVWTRTYSDSKVWDWLFAQIRK